MKTVLRFSLLGALLLGGHAFAAEPKKFDISMFPAAEVNQERVVIRLPEVENEADMMAATNATFKLGIMFENWRDVGKDYKCRVDQSVQR